MARNKKKEKSNPSKEKGKKEVEYNPFQNIVLKEKKEEIKTNALVSPNKKDKKTEKIVSNLPKKRPSEIIQGYDPNASFADILYSYEKTGSLYSAKKPKYKKDVKVNENKESFASILEKWEGTKSKPKSKITNNISTSSYKPTKSFEELLNQFEGKTSTKEKEIENKEAILKPKKEVEIKTTSFFKENEEIERSKEASWSILGGNDSYIRKEPKEVKKEDFKKVQNKKETKKNVYIPQEDFASILNKFENKTAIKGNKKEEIKETKIDKEEEKKGEGKPKLNLGRDIAWSILGDNEDFIREEVKEVKIENKERTSSNKIKNKKMSLNLQKELNKEIEVKTFEEILKEKNQSEERSEDIPLTKLRNMLPQATLDLHGEKIIDAIEEVNNFILDSYNHHLRKISIITGKGLHSENGVSVIKEEVESLLKDSPYITEKNNAPLSHGGQGAFWIILKVNK